MSDTIGFALLGAGYMGQIHARALSRLPEARLLWVVGRSEQRTRQLAEQVNAKAATDPATAINDPAVDAVLIAYPSFLHRDLTMQALAAGKHVLCEKPIALTLKDADAMISAATEAALAAGHTESGSANLASHRLMIGHVVRFWPEYATILELAKSGELGRVLSVELERLSTAPGWADWFQDVEMSGGMVTDLMVHDFDIAAALVDTPETVAVSGVRTENGNWQHTRALITDENGSHALVTGSHLMPNTYPFTSSIRVIGDKATAEYRFVAGGTGVEDGGQPAQNVLRLYRHGESASASRGEIIEVTDQDAFDAQLQYFIDCVRQNVPFNVGTPQQARLALAIALAAHGSLESGQPVKVPR